MPDKKLVPASYKRLVAEIASLYEGARKALVEAYWKIGQRIVQVEQQGEIKAAYGTGLLQKLSEDLTEQCGPGFSTDNLLRMRKFYLAYPKTATSRKLDWSHFVELLKVRDGKERIRLEKRVIEEELATKEIRALVRHELVREQVAKNLATPSEKRKPPELLPVPKPRPFYIYQLKAAAHVGWPETNVLLLDRGFRSYKALTPAEGCNLRMGDIGESSRTKFRKASHTHKDLYAYEAYLQKVIDGDTLWTALDTGQRNIEHQKLRLRGIDCPEINTKEGQAAKKFVEDLLRDVPSLTVLSSKNASYDRYEADVFFMDKEGGEQYLNNLLLQAGLAVRVRE